jgi:thioredoxin reductase
VRGTELVQQFEAYVEAKLTALIPHEAKQVIQCRNGGFQLTLANTDLISARALIICTGAQPQRLYVRGEHDFLGKGISYSAISHAQFFRKRNVAVIGGERALHAVIKLAAIANRVYYVLAHSREITDSNFAETILNHPKVSLFRDWEVQAVEGNDFVTTLSLVAINGETRAIPVDGVFVELGLLPNNDLVHDLVGLDEEGRIIVNHHCETNIPGLFAAGDVTNVYAEQVPVAIGEGVKAALSAWTYLSLHKHSFYK